LALGVWFGLANCLVAVGQALNPGADIISPVPKFGGTLRLAWSGDIRSLDPTTLYSGMEGVIAMMIYTPLLDHDRNERIVPKLATALPTVSPDGRTYTFHLRPGVRFSNGRVLVADDVVYSLERHLDPRFHSSYANYYVGIAGAASFAAARSKELTATNTAGPSRNPRWVEPTSVSGLRALDRYTVEIILDQPDVTFSDILATPYSVVVPREQVERWGDSLGTHPLGTGPFALQEWQRGIRYVLKRNPHYYLAPEPHVDAVEVLANVDLFTQQMMFERGELDYVDGPSGQDLVRLQRLAQFKHCIAAVVGLSPKYIALNCEMPPFTNRLVRQAMNYAVNKERLLKANQGLGVIAHGVLPPTVKGFNPDLPGYPYDPAKARSLLAEAGLRDGFAVPSWFIGDAGQIALLVQQDLAAVGVTVQLHQVSGAALLDEAGRRKAVPMSIWSWGADFDDPKDTLDFLVNGERIVDDGCLNYAFYSNLRVNELFHQAAPELDSRKRLGLYQELERMVADDAPWIFLFNGDYYTLHQAWVKGYKMNSIWPDRLEEVWLDK